MNATDAITLLSKLGCSNVKMNTSGTWVVSTCPFASWTHKSGVDKHPSFGVSIHWDSKELEGESKFKCYTCNLSGSIAGDDGLIQRLKKRLRRELPRIENSDATLWAAIRNVPSKSQISERSKNTTNTSAWKLQPGTMLSSGTGSAFTADTAEKLQKAPPPLPESTLDIFTAPSPELMTYLRTERRLTDESIAKWELKWHAGRRRIGIPIRDEHGNLVGVSGRAFDEGQRPKFLHTTGFKRDFYLYGERTCRRNEPGYLTEGFFDVIYLQQKGINAFAIMGSYLSRIQVEKCATMFTKIVMVPDGDEAGDKTIDHVKQRLGDRMPVVVYPMTEGKDPDDLSDEELADLRKL